MRLAVQVIGNYFKQEIPTILITADNQTKYVFNVSSSLQRYSLEQRVDLRENTYYFFTRSKLSCFDGLVGLLVSLFSDGGSCKTKLYLDNKLFNYLDHLRASIRYKFTPVSYCRWDGKVRKGISNYEEVKKLRQFQHLSHFTSFFDKYMEKNIKKQYQNNAAANYNHKTKAFQNGKLKILHFTVPDGEGDFINNYIVQPGSSMGKILQEKLQSFGIRKRAVKEIIEKGKIKISDGQVVTLDEVKEPDYTNPDILILHYNSLQTLSEISYHPVFKSHLANPKNLIFAVYHIIQKPEIVTSPQFQQFLSIFPAHVEHTIYNRHYRNSKDTLQDFIAMSAQIQFVSSFHQHFPICMPDLFTQQFSFLTRFIRTSKSIDLMFPERKVRAYNKFEEIVLNRGLWGFNTVQKRKMEDFNFQNIDIPHMNLPLQKQMQQKFAKLDPKIIFLGTGSSSATLYRTVSSIMVELTQKNLIMLDCGQGTHIQVAEHYGYERYEDILINLRIIFITHIHMDHTEGILKLISQRNAFIRKRKMDVEGNKLFLIIPANMISWFQSFCSLIQNLEEYTEIVYIQSLHQVSNLSKDKEPNPSICPKINQKMDKLQLDKELREQMNQKQQASLLHLKTYLQSIGIVQFKPCPVIHCLQSYGIIIQHKTGIKISYSGDTRPSQEFAQAAHNSTILIHQATFLDQKVDQAKSRLHSTVQEAISIGMKSKSWKTALTHFSKRCKNPCQIVDPSKYKDNHAKEEYAQKHTIVCFDHFEVNLSKAHLLPYYSRALAATFPKKEE